MENYVSPSYQGKSFNCPHCHVNAQQYWSDVYYLPHGASSVKNGFNISTCNNCSDIVIWKDSQIVYPIVSLAPPPNQDMKDDPKKDYLEARDIVERSPRSACLLLRVCIEKTINDLVKGTGDLNEKIKKLVAQGLDPDIQKALDTVRVIGGQAGHSLEMDLTDDRETATALFEITNLIVDSTITKKKKVDAMYGKLPQSKIDAINKRDGKSP